MAIEVETPRAGDSARTTVGARESGRAEGPRRQVRGVRRSEVLSIVGAGLAAVSITWLIFTQFTSLTGLIGWVAIGYLVFVVFYAALVSLDENREAVRDRVVSVVVTSLAVLLITALVSVLLYVIVRAIPAIRHPNFFREDLSVTGSLQPLTSGGVLHGIIGTLEMIAMAMIITVPSGLLCAVFLNEFRGPYVRFARTLTEAMTALPSIVAGLFIYSTLIVALGFNRSALTASLALSVMMLPIIVRAADVVIRLVPSSLKEASYALGAGQWRTVWNVTLPSARSGLGTAVILGTARGIGETSPVLLTAGSTQSINVDPLHNSMVSLPLLAFQLFNLPSDQMKARAFGAAGTLLILVIALFAIARMIGGRGLGNLSRRQLRRRVAQSRAEGQRFADREQRRAAGDHRDAFEVLLQGHVTPSEERQ